MNSIYVAWQNEGTREWVPVARLSRLGDQYELRYTRGAERAVGFSGLGRMNHLATVYKSNSLFPFFTNRLISKSRPEYAQYLHWLGLENTPDHDPLEVLALTGGIRATDSFEIIPRPEIRDEGLTLDFFTRGLRHQYLPASPHETLREGAPSYLMLDLQNNFDPMAIAIRSQDPKLLLGYVPKYYSKRLCEKLREAAQDVKATIKRFNPEAPLDMRVLVRVSIKNFRAQSFYDSETDFDVWDQTDRLTRDRDAMKRATGALDSVVAPRDPNVVSSELLGK